MSEDSARMMFFSGTANPDLGREIAAELGQELGKVEISRFADSEVYVRLLESVRGAHVFVIQSLSQPVNDNLMELCVMVDALKRASAGPVSVVIPYYGYARQDKKTLAREPISARLVADILTAAGAHRILTMDLHAGQIQGFFNLPVDHLTAAPLLVEYFREKKLSDPIVVSPDVGRAQTAEKLSAKLGTTFAVIAKRRPAHNVSQVTHIVGDVKGKQAIMMDDMIDTAGTICRGAEALKKAGAAEVYASCTHAILSGTAIENLNLCPIKELVVTNTIPVSIEKYIEKITVLSVGPIFAATIKAVYENRSVSEIFGGTDHV